MATTQRRSIGPATVGAQAPATDDNATKPEDAKPAEAAPVAEQPKAVDPESEDYKAGYQAGYDAGLATCESNRTPAEPPAEPAAGKAEAAKSYDLVAAFPEDKGFCMDYLAECEKNGTTPTILGAKAAYADVLAPKLKAANERAADAERKLAAESDSPPPITTARSASASEVDANTDNPKAKAAAEWDANPAVRAGFSSKENFVAIRAAEMSGHFRQVRVEPPAAPATK